MAHQESEAERARREDLQKKGRTFYTIGQFTRLLGVNRSWYYLHTDDPGMPQRVYFGGKPLLVYQECLDYIDAAVAARGQPRKKNSRGAQNPG